jgi:hypothetical protein
VVRANRIDAAFRFIVLAKACSGQGFAFQAIIGEVPNRLHVCLIRRKDGQAVASDFSLQDVRAAGGSRWELRLIAERPVAFSRFFPFPVGGTRQKLEAGSRARMRVSPPEDIRQARKA